jgi:hypothetical protein
MYSSFYAIYPNPSNGHSIAKVVTASIWTAYDANKIRIINHTTLVDTLFWDGLDDQQNYSASRIPDKKAALEIAAGIAGANYSKNFIPNLGKYYRNMLSCNNLDFKKATELASNDNWDKASALWEKYSESTNKQYKKQALFNLALANEMNGNIDAAIELISKALEVKSSIFYSAENKIIRKYSAALAERKIELKKINSMNYNL